MATCPEAIYVRSSGFLSTTAAPDRCLQKTVPSVQEIVVSSVQDSSTERWSSLSTSVKHGLANWLKLIWKHWIQMFLCSEEYTTVNCALWGNNSVDTFTTDFRILSTCHVLLRKLTFLLYYQTTISLCGCWPASFKTQTSMIIS